jgi:hypothetical protein
MTIQISNFKVLATGVDGGHKYIETELFHSGQLRKLTVLFKNKSEEAKIQAGITLTLFGTLQDDGIDYGVLLLDTEII